MGFVNPPLCFEASGRTFAIEALNARGEVLVAPVHEALSRCDAVEAISLSQTEAGAAVLRGSVKPPAAGFAEEQRSRQHSIFSLVRALRRRRLLVILQHLASGIGANPPRSVGPRLGAGDLRLQGLP